MPDVIKICTDRLLPLEEAPAAADTAIEENPENLPNLNIRALPGANRPPRDRIAILAGKKWLPGRTLKVRFIDGAAELQTKVAQTAKEWSQHANITLNFGTHADAEIRVSFSTGGSWSYLGTDALSIPAAEQTMNFGWLTPTSAQDEISRVVLHEFGHALGAIHEHQNPNVAIPWDKAAVYAYYGGPPNNWTKSQVDSNIFAKYALSQTNSSAFDKKSIMLYAIPNQLTIGDYEVGWNRVLSDIDKSFMRSIYPGAIAAPIELNVQPDWAKAAIGASGEQDLFTFVAETAGGYSVETHGATDVVMQLLGPDSQTALVGQDDDSGVIPNARISAQLGAGRYYVRVRHYRQTGTGNYEISVRHTS